MILDLIYGIQGIMMLLGGLLFKIDYPDSTILSGILVILAAANILLLVPYMIEHKCILLVVHKAIKKRNFSIIFKSYTNKLLPFTYFLVMGCNIVYYIIYFTH